MFGLWALSRSYYDSSTDAPVTHAEANRGFAVHGGYLCSFGFMLFGLSQAEGSILCVSYKRLALSEGRDA